MWNVIEECIKSPVHGWSMGSSGAIGEFNWDADEDCFHFNDGRLGCITDRGALALTLRDDLEPLAYEYLTKNPGHWTQGIAFCLDAEKAKMKNYSVVTELGPDEDALKAEHKKHILFDMGLNQGFVDIAIRTDNAELIDALRQACGSNLLMPGNPAMAAIIKAGPHRVFTTALGRLEVYQPIGIEKSPEGPHTHVLPKLMASGRAFSANVPIRDGMLPMLTLHAANPCRDLLGKDKPFDQHQFQQFQHWLQRFGLHDYYQQKQQVFDWLDANQSSDDINPGESRLLRTATRVAIRQYEKLQPNKSSLLVDWRRRFDKVVDAAVSQDVGHG